MKYVIVATVLAMIVACGSADQQAGPKLTDEQKANAGKDTANFTSIEWLDSTTKNLGQVKDGQVVEIAYRFRNTGSKPLIIESVNAGCGCTVPEKPERPYAPGEEGVIKAKFDSRNRKGPNNKYVAVTANTTPTKSHTLVFNIEVTE